MDYILVLHILEKQRRYHALKLRSKIYLQICLLIAGKVKSKAIPLQAWRGPEGFWRMRLPDFKTNGT
jgi:hypothetical protein